MGRAIRARDRLPRRHRPLPAARPLRWAGGRGPSPPPRPRPPGARTSPKLGRDRRRNAFPREHFPRRNGGLGAPVRCSSRAGRPRATSFNRSQVAAAQKTARSPRRPKTEAPPDRVRAAAWRRVLDVPALARGGGASQRPSPRILRRLAAAAACSGGSDVLSANRPFPADSHARAARLRRSPPCPRSGSVPVTRNLATDRRCRRLPRPEATFRARTGPSESDRRRAPRVLDAPGAARGARRTQ